jgi:hypothetical protein
MDQALVDAVRQARRAIGTKLRIDYVGMVEDFRGSICELHVRGNSPGTTQIHGWLHSNDDCPLLDLQNSLDGLCHWWTCTHLFRCHDVALIVVIVIVVVGEGCLLDARKHQSSNQVRLLGTHSPVVTPRQSTFPACSLPCRSSPPFTAAAHRQCSLRTSHHPHGLQHIPRRAHHASASNPFMYLRCPYIHNTTQPPPTPYPYPLALPPP